MCQKFCARFWQFDMLTKRINCRENPNIEIRTVFDIRIPSFLAL
jgi:hypothetical protein